MDVAINKPIYTIDERNDIAIHPEGVDPAEGVSQFRSQAELAALGAKWPSSRLLDIWNRLPNVTPVKKFTNRQTALRRIWDALQPPKVAQQVRKPQVPKPKTNKRVISKHPGSKSETVIELLRQQGGATLQALMVATGWQAHSVRGFISGQLTKKMRYKVRSFTRDGQRVYSIRS
jgi:Protein of unknown function (DUF3489)